MVVELCGEQDVQACERHEDQQLSRLGNDEIVSMGRNFITVLLPCLKFSPLALIDARTVQSSPLKVRIWANPGLKQQNLLFLFIIKNH